MSAGSVAAALEPPARQRDLLHDPRLWITVGLVAVLAAAWLLAALLVGHPLSGSSVAFLPLGVFLVPVLYASVAFGLEGGMVLAIVAAAATVPWAMASLSRQDTLGAWSDFVQAVVLVVVAYFVGRAVRAERRAREVAELSRLDHLLAEVRYRDLFETNSQPILIAGLGGTVHEANLAALELFGRDGLGGITLLELLGPAAAAAVLPGGAESVMVEVPPPAGGPPAVYRPAGRVVAIDGEEMLQVVLQDVTEDARRRELAQAYAADVLRGQEDERRRIAQELHDGPLQTLVHLCRLIDATGAPAAGAPGGGLHELRATTESVVAEVRRIARGLRPPLLDDLGLRAALERLCDDVELRAGVAASLRVEGELPPLPAPAELTVYRIVQEALSNVDRHAGASTVSIRLWAADGWLQLRVADDGHGFEAAADDADWRARGTLGIAGMAERAELVGGRLRVASRPGAGTTVGAAIPVGTPARVPAAGTVPGPPVPGPPTPPVPGAPVPGPPTPPVPGAPVPGAAAGGTPAAVPVPDPGPYPLRR